MHALEAFGPVCTVMGYDGLQDAALLANRGEGSLVASLYTHDPAAATELVFGVSPYHGRLVVIDRDCAKEQTGHGSPMPHMMHGGPGGPAAARSWAACGLCPTTCSARRCRARPRC